MGEEQPEKRETWNRKIDFLLACIGFSVGLGNVWRFPYLCYKNGGGAFLVPYLICVVVGGIPLFFLEVALGQFMSEGGVNAWRICPILQGIGWSTTFIVFFLNCYYNVILAWAFYYVFASFTDKLPWEECGQYWNTLCCREVFGENSTSGLPALEDTNCTKFMDPTTEFWERKVLNISMGIDDQADEIKWDLALTLFVAWMVVYFCIMQGIKTSGKVMYFTATSPYLFMTILLIRNCLLDGSLKGILYYTVPDFEKITDIGVWVDAGTQIFFSYSISLGALTALGSYNEFHHNSYRDSLIFAFANSGTSIFAGFVIFSILGFMAKEQGIDDVGQVAESGPGLAFIAYPKAVSQMPGAPFWSILFFIMVILLGLDSQFVGVEGMMTAIFDTFPVLKKGYRREFTTAFMCFVMFLIGLCMVTNAGMYTFQLFDYYSGSRIILLVAFFMCIAIAYIYGVNRFYDNTEMMFGFRLHPYMWVSWLFTAPAFCMTVFCMSAVNYTELDYTRPSTGLYTYPDWAVTIGWCLAGVSAFWIPFYAVYNTIKYLCQGKSFIEVFKPQGLRTHQLREEDYARGEVAIDAGEGGRPGYDFDNPAFEKV